MKVFLLFNFQIWWKSHSEVVTNFPKSYKFRTSGPGLQSDSLFATLSLYSPWNSPGQNTGVCSLSLLQGIFPTQGSNPGLPHCRQIFYQLSNKGSPRMLESLAYPFSSGSSRPRNRTGVSCIAGGFFTSWTTRETPLWVSLSFPADSSVGEESACNAGDQGSIPGSGRSSGEGIGYPLQYSGLENSMDCIDHGVAKVGHDPMTFTFPHSR